MSSSHARVSWQLVAAIWVLAGFLAAPTEASTEGVAELFGRGQQALAGGDLTQAEAAFRAVLAIHPDDAGAHGNLGVIAMRRKQWKTALSELRAAEKLAPANVGIRLNIGLVYFRQNDFRAAILPFESVLHAEPESAQARYLLGLCYFFVERYGDSASVLVPLWPEESEKLEYLYVVAIAAARCGREELHQQALQRMIEVGRDSAELHLFIAKSYLQHMENERAAEELESAARIDPKLPFVHYFLGVAYRRKHNLERAKAEFQKDMEIEPDVAFDYDQLGAVCADLEEYPDAVRFFQEALRLDSHLASSQFGLGKIYKKQGKFSDALRALEAAARLDPASSNIHYLKGQVLVRLGRPAEGQAELKAAETLMRAEKDKFGRELNGESFPDPQLAAAGK
jgi:tetratricopeptide (TPR) repeat protein